MLPAKIRDLFVSILFVMTATSGLVMSPSVSAQQDMVVVEVITNVGTIELSLDRKRAPVSVDNFLQYAESGFYEGTVFHRVIKNFMIQGGGFTTDMRRKPTSPAIVNEADNGLNNDRGTIAMARTSLVNSATSQFFINVKDNAFLNHKVRDFGYAVFGRVTKGMEVVDAIAKRQTAARDVPINPVVIRSVAVIDKKKP